MIPSPLSRLREALQTESIRTRLIAMIFVLGTILGLPTPLAYAQTHDRILMLALWGALTALVWLLWTSSYYVKLVWFLAFIASLLAWWKLDLFVPCVMIVLWAIWYAKRFKRVQKQSADP